MQILHFRTERAQNLGAQSINVWLENFFELFYKTRSFLGAISSNYFWYQINIIVVKWNYVSWWYLVNTKLWKCNSLLDNAPPFLFFQESVNVWPDTKDVIVRCLVIEDFMVLAVRIGVIVCTPMLMGVIQSLENAFANLDGKVIMTFQKSLSVVLLPEIYLNVNKVVEWEREYYTYLLETHVPA